MAEYYTETEEIKEENKGQNFKFIFLFVILLVVIAAGVAGLSFINNSENSTTETPDREETTLNDDETKTVYSAIEADDSFKKLEELIIIADLADVLQNPNQEITILAPTDSAFEEIKSTIDDLVEAEDTTRLREILLAHVITGKRNVSDLAQEEEIQTLNQNSKLTPSVENGELKLSLNDFTTTVFSPDVDVQNGYIQVVNKVLLP